MPNEHGLGRIFKPDARDRRFMAREVLNLDRKIPKERFWRTWWFGDQGASNHCVGYSSVAILEAQPLRPKKTKRQFPVHNPDHLYFRALELDEYPGTNDEGTSIRAGMEALKETGYISEYRWMYDVATVAQVIALEGPVVLGVNWYESMNDPDGMGQIVIEGRLRGGHAIVADGVDFKEGDIRLHNSWGENWGIHGKCFISFENLQRLLSENGEACFPVEKDWK